MRRSFLAPLQGLICIGLVTLAPGYHLSGFQPFQFEPFTSSVPFEPKRCGVRGYLMKLSRVAPMI